MNGSRNQPQDRWGRDPAVQSLRRAFALMEKRQKELLARSGISEFEPRLAPARREARLLLEKGWALAAEQGLALNEEAWGAFYEHLLAAVLARLGLGPAPDELTDPWGPLVRRLLNQEG